MKTYSNTVLLDIANQMRSLTSASAISFMLMLVLALFCNPGLAATLAGSLEEAPDTINLTAEGTTDWAHWSGGNNYNHRDGVTPQISNFTVIGSETPNGAGADSTYNWTNGTPLAASSTATGSRVFDLNNGFQITAPADTTTRTLKFYVGAKNARGMLTASLSDNSSPDYSILVDQPSRLGSHVVTLNYQAASAAQTLTVTYVMETRYRENTTASQINIEAATLVAANGGGGASNQPPVLAPIGPRSVTEGELLTIPVSASDDDGPAPLTLSATNLPAGANFTDSGNGVGEFSWTPPEGAAGSSPYTVNFRATDGDNAFDAEAVEITVNPVGGGGGGSGGTLAGALAQAPDSVNLTAEGTTDWAHWSGGNNYNHRDGVTPQISNFTVIGSEIPVGAGADSTYNWTNGTPLAAASTATGSRVFDLNNGFQITVPADTTTRTLKFYVGAKNARGMLTASLSDNSSPDYSILVDQPSQLGSHVVTLNYQAASAAQTLTVRFVLETRYRSGATASQINIEAATLVAANGGGGGGGGLPLPFTDDFNDGNADGWIVFDEAGNPSDWRATNSQYRQLNQVRQSSVANLVESYHTASFSYLNAGFGLQDYRFSVGVIPQGQFGDDVGVMFRYQDPDNYYRLSFDSRFGYTRLEKRVNGQFSPLATNTTGYAFGARLDIQIDVIGTLIFVTVDNDLLFAIQDSSLSQGTVALYSAANTHFDDVVIDNPPATPVVALSQPLSHSVGTTDSISASALVANAPTAMRVDFVLDGTTTISDFTAPYSVTFNTIIQGNHTVEARLFDSNGNQTASDQNTVIGTEGNNYLTAGDSISNGAEDNFASDNASDDGRIFGFQGYQAELNNALTQTLGQPHLLVNEAVGGDTSARLLNQRLDSILARNPASNMMLMFLGTNDATGSLPIPSGLGCNGASCNGTFKGNMQIIIDEAANNGKSTFVAQAPPSFGSTPTSTPFSDPLNTARNNTIQEYNEVVRNELTNRSLGPNLFQCFLGANNRFSLFADNFHPNGLGYSVIAQLWHDILTGVALATDPCTNLPRFVLENLSKSTVSPYLKQNLIEPGDNYYVNENFTVTNIPPGLGLENGVWIMNSNAVADRNNSDANNYIAFSVDRPVTVYVGYDNRASLLPGWLGSNFNNTGAQLQVSQPGTQFTIYSQNLPAGVVSLGGNQAFPATGAQANYVVIVVPQ